MLRRGFDVHPGTPWIWREKTEFWSEETCSFCGSIKPETLLLYLSQGNDAAGSDWKNGWPHKFYVASPNGQWWKFYNEHLSDIEDEVLEPLLVQITEVLKISFKFDTLGRLTFTAPSQGFKTWRTASDKE